VARVRVPRRRRRVGARHAAGVQTRVQGPTEYLCIDSSYVKNRFGRTCVGRNHTDRGRKALKLSLVVDQSGIPHAFSCDPGNRPDVCLFASTLSKACDELDRLPIYADRGYDSRRNRSACANLGSADRIFRRKCKTTRRTNAKRIVVEHSFAWMGRFRRLLLCYEQTPRVFEAFCVLAFVHLMCMRLPSDLSGAQT